MKAYIDPIFSELKIRIQSLFSKESRYILDDKSEIITDKKSQHENTAGDTGTEVSFKNMFDYPLRCNFDQKIL